MPGAKRGTSTAQTTTLEELDRAIELAFKAKALAYDPQAQDWFDEERPDLAALEKLLKLKAQIHGLLRDEAPPTETTEVSEAELRETLEANGYELRKKEINGTDPGADGDDGASAAKEATPEKRGRRLRQ